MTTETETELNIIGNVVFFSFSVAVVIVVLCYYLDSKTYVSFLIVSQILHLHENTN